MAQVLVARRGEDVSAAVRADEEEVTRLLLELVEVRKVTFSSVPLSSVTQSNVTLSSVTLTYVTLNTMTLSNVTLTNVTLSSVTTIARSPRDMTSDVMSSSCCPLGPSSRRVELVVS